MSISPEDAARSLAASETAYAATYGCLAMTAFMAVTGPLVTRWISWRFAARVEGGR